MSRSYKKFPWCGDTKTVGKKLANKAVRNGKYKNYDIPDGGWYKKVYNQYNVCDYGSFETWEECLERYRNPPYPWSYIVCRYEDEQEMFRAWCKYHRNK